MLDFNWKTSLHTWFCCQFRIGFLGPVDTNPLPIEPLPIVHIATHGSGVALRHWWLQAHRDSLIADCGVGFDYMFENFPLQKALTLVFRGTGDCAAIDWTFLGLSLPQLALLAYLGLAAYALYILKK
jgi:disulfide bond formation protein DsbB